MIKSQLLYQLSYRGNLLQYVSTRKFYGRVTVDGKIYRESLETIVYSVAKQKLPDYVRERPRKKRQTGAPATFAEARKLYEQDLDNDHALSESMKRYRRYCIKKLLDSWPGLDNLKLNRINEADCKEWAGRIATEIDEQYFNNTLGTLAVSLAAASSSAGAPASPLLKCRDTPQ